MADNFEAIDLSWVKNATDPLVMLRQGLDFLEDPSKINNDNCERWCNLHITPALQGFIMEVCSLEEVTYWAKKGQLGSDSDPMEPRIANLIVAFGASPWPHTLGLARVHVAPNQKLCSITHAMESAKEHFSLEDRLDSPHYYLTPIHTEALYILSDAGLQTEEGGATVIGVAVMGIDLTDNTVNLAASKGPTSTLMVCHLLHLKASLVIVPPQLSCPVWTGMRRVKIWYKSFIHFTAPYAPLGRLELDVNGHQLGFIRNLIVPKLAVLLSLAEQLDNLRVAPPEPREAITESHGEEGTREETPKKAKSAETGDPPKRHHKSHEEKSQLRHSLTEKSPASSSCEHDVVLKAEKLGDVVAQACLSVARMLRVVEKAHNSKTAEALLVRQCLEKASADAINSTKDEIQGTHTPADIWQVEKISAHVSHKRAKAYSTLTEHHDSVSNDLTGKGRLSSGSSEIADTEEDFRKSISTLVSTVITKGAKVPGEHGAALTSSILCLVPTLPLNPVLTPTIDLPLEKECRIALGDTSRNVPMSQNIMSSLPSSPLTGGASAPMVAGRHTIKFGQAVIQPVTFTQPALDSCFFKKPTSTPISMPQKVWETPEACSSPLLKESRASPQDTPDLTQSSTEPSVVIEDVASNDDDDEDETPAHDRLGSSKVKGICESSKQRESPPTKKAWTEDSGAHKPKSRQVSCASWDEWGKHDRSKKGPDYKEMHYLTFAPVSELEQLIFKKCSFDQLPVSHPSPL